MHRLAAALLGLEALGVDDDLLDLGMDSLMLAELAVQVADILGWAPDVASLIRAPTIAAISALAGPATGLVPLAAGPGRLTIVLVPGAGATVAYLRPLAHLLAPLGNVVAHPAGDEASIDSEADRLMSALRCRTVDRSSSWVIPGEASSPTLRSVASERRVS